MLEGFLGPGNLPSSLDPEALDAIITRVGFDEGPERQRWREIAENIRAAFQRPIEIFDKRIEEPTEIPDTFLAYKTVVVEGDIEVPKIALNQPLRSKVIHLRTRLST